MRFRYSTVICVIMLLSVSGFAQDSASWKIVLNKKAVFTSYPGADTSANLLKIKKSDLDNNGIFKVEYTEPKNNPTRTWVRTMAIFDTASNVVVQRDSATLLQLYNRDIMKILWSRKRILVYSWTAPADPGMAAAVRIRRTHLCTIELLD